MQSRVRVSLLAMVGFFLQAIPLQAANVITIGTGGGYPGDLVRTVTVSMTNTDTLSGLQFTLRDSPDYLKATAVTLGSRLTGFSSPSFNDTLGVVKIVIFSFGGRLNPGSGPIFNVKYTVNAAAQGVVVPLIFDQIVLSDFRARTVAASGVNGSFDVLSSVVVSNHPEGQPPNQFVQATMPTSQDLHRFGLSIPTSTAQISRLGFFMSKGQIATSGLQQFGVFPDTDGDGASDGTAFPATATVTSDSVIFTNLNLPLNAGTTKYFVVRGTVGFTRVGEGITLNLVPDGIAGTYSGATYSDAVRTVTGSTVAAAHTVTATVGDPNGDLKHNVADVIRIVRVIIGLAVIDDPVLYDIDTNGRVDVGDVVSLIQSILTN